MSFNSGTLVHNSTLYTLYIYFFEENRNFTFLKNWVSLCTYVPNALESLINTKFL